MTPLTHKKTIQEYEERIQEMEGFVKFRDQRILELTSARDALQVQTTQLAVRLDACLYAMVLFQSQIRSMADKQFKFNEKTNSWENVSLAT